MNCENSIQSQQDFIAFMAAWGSRGDLFLDSTSVPYKRLLKYIIKLDDIKFADTIFRLNAPISVTIYEEDATWYCENQDFSSLTFGSTAQEAVQSFCEDFSVLWDEVAQSPDETLNSDAQRVKQALRSAVKTVDRERDNCR
jgi:hypothetical protein